MILQSSVSEEIELIKEASESQSVVKLKDLSKSVYMNVRKAVARNKSADSSIINKMAQIEIAAPVIFWLQKNPYCSVKRSLSDEDLSNKCVTCSVSERELCNTCPSCTKKRYKD